MRRANRHIYRDDTLDQWEHGLLESKWAYTDPATGAPRMLLLLKHWPVDHRVFQLVIRNPWEGEPTPRIEIWTGTYKMMSRRLPGGQLSNQDMMQLVRLSFEQHWVPEERGHYWPPVQEYPLHLPYDGPNKRPAIAPDPGRRAGGRRPDPLVRRNQLYPLEGT